MVEHLPHFMYNYRITRLRFSDGQHFEPSSLTVIVGPNNCGKSRALKDVLSLATERNDPGSVMVKEIDWTYPDSIEELRKAYAVERHMEQGISYFRTLNPDLSSELNAGEGGAWPSALSNCIDKRASRAFAKAFGPALIACLTTEHRLTIVKECSSPSHEKQIATLLHALYNAGREAETAIRTLVKDAFGQEIALDFTVLNKLLLRLGCDFSGLPQDPRDAKQALAAHEKLDAQGDGIRSFVGIVVALLSLRRHVFLIDEPETFLHPPQAYRIGQFIAEQATSGKQIFLATHSADVLRGVLSKTTDARIVRFDRVGHESRIRLLDMQRLKSILNDPLLSSARVLDGLFYGGAVVVEADSDARFYQSASIRRGTQLDLHFVNADNKQTVPRITKLYRDMGVRCVGIVDFDVLNDPTEFRKQLEAMSLNSEDSEVAVSIRDEIGKAAKEVGTSERLVSVMNKVEGILAKIVVLDQTHFKSHEERRTAEEQLLRQMENRLREAAEATKGWRALKQGGRSALPDITQGRYDALSSLCARNGLFINPAGELESMLTEYGIPSTSDKRGWIIQALQLIPSLSVDDTRKPWNFMKRIHDYLRETN